jgi:peptidoglycan biosynthesis protein MviN/MurJ (putative lipid II flippase)
VSLLKSLSTVSGMTLLSRITGLARESLKATAFGAGVQMDAFEAAFRLPNILRRLFAEGAFSQAFVPIFAEYRRRRGEAETKALVGRVGTLLAIALLALSIVGVFAAPWLVYMLASGFAQIWHLTFSLSCLFRCHFPSSLCSHFFCRSFSSFPHLVLSSSSSHLSMRALQSSLIVLLL